MIDDPGLDADLKQRLHEVLARRPVTEAELRKVLDEGRVCASLVRGRLERGEQRLSELVADPESPLAEVASALRVVNDLRPRLQRARVGPRRAAGAGARIPAFVAHR